MFRRFLLLAFLLPCISHAQNNDSLIIRKIYDEALTNGKAYSWLDHLCNSIGSRLTGSDNAAKAVEYVNDELSKLQIDKSYKQEMMVPHWVRGEKEQAWTLVNGKKVPYKICALGGSIGTGEKGVTSQLIEVYDWEEMNKLGKEKISGKIVFLNHAMNPKHINPFESYGESAKYRYATASKAAALGAISVVVRSMNVSIDDYPHTGAMGYVDSIAKIPTCAISTYGADLLSTSLKHDPSLNFYFLQTCATLDEVVSYNVIGEIKGSEFPDEIIIIGGHLDSWDLAQGASDDGTGVVQSMEVLNLFKALNLHPKRTIRCVAFMNEENGLRGGKKYAEVAKQKRENHIAAIESDEGGFTPRGFTFNGDSIQIQKLISYKKMFTQYGLHDWVNGYGGSDINPLEDQGTMLIGFSPDPQRYFDIHHSALDTFDRVSKRELELGAASITSLVWLLSQYGVK